MPLKSLFGWLYKILSFGRHKHKRLGGPKYAIFMRELLFFRELQNNFSLYFYETLNKTFLLLISSIHVVLPQVVSSDFLAKMIGSLEFVFRSRAFMRIPRITIYKTRCNFGSASNLVRRKKDG